MATIDELLQPVTNRIKSPGASVQTPAQMPGSEPAKPVSMDEHLGPVKAEVVREKAALRDTFGKEAWQDEKDALKDAFGGKKKQTPPATTTTWTPGTPATPGTPTAQGTPVTPGAGTEKKPAGTFEELVNQLSPYKPKTPEEQAAEERRQKRNLTFSAIGDTVSALSNLYFTTQYAPNMFNPRESMTERQRARYDKMNAQDKADQANYLNYMLTAMGKDQDKADKDRAFNFQLQQYGDARKDAEAAAAAQGEQFRLKLAADAEKADKDRQNALEIARIRAAGKGSGNGDGSGKGKDKASSFVYLSNGSAKGSKGAQYKIHPDVWAGCMPHIFNILSQEAIQSGKKTQTDFKGMSVADQENYVKQHWNESETAKEWLEYYAGLDPETFESFYDEPIPAPTEIPNKIPQNLKNGKMMDLPKSTQRFMREKQSHIPVWEPED